MADTIRHKGDNDRGSDTPIEGRRKISQTLQNNYSTDQQMVKCRNSNCNKIAETADAKKLYKNCHNCSYMYCSRECRRAHWEKHRKFCLHSRVSTLCRHVINSAKDDEMSLRHISLMARQGYETHGRGVVKLTFKSPESAECFVKNGFQKIGDLKYIKWPDLVPAEMGSELYSELLRLCTAYEPLNKLVLYVSVCVVSEAPGSGAVKWERQLVSRCAKLRLAKSVISETIAKKNSEESANEPETIIFTPLSGDGASQKLRELFVENIHRHLRRKGVNLRRHFPEIHSKLSSYADVGGDRFAPLTIHPKDECSGKTFMCIIMPVVDREKLSDLPVDRARIKIVDISLKQENEAPSTV
ncbi:apical junction component 1 homolog [Ctenocephalides felis]|uniref:apical junction component 1 homolog n=1 Tax=Ctenocephalides felis TaxID=7515 RepID=UPI000E6E5113|nr:apical junction component 1 homolog [Ctenocephalides felis]